MSASLYRNFSDIIESLAKIDPDSVLSAETLTHHFTSELKGHKQHVRDTYQACLGRLAEPQFAVTKYASSKTAAKHIVTALTCPEFLIRVPQMLQQTFPQVPRTFFLHIPKTGGSDVIQRFQSQGWFVWHDSWKDPEWLSEAGGVAALLKNIIDFSASETQHITFGGHFTISDLVRENHCRSYDNVFTIIRHPEEMIVSALNYYIMAMIDCPTRSDGRLWRSWLEGTGITPPDCDEDVTMKMVECLLFHPGFSRECENMILRHLSTDGTLSSAIENIKIYNVHVVGNEAANEFLHREFDVMPSAIRHNISRRFVHHFDELPKKWRLHARTMLFPVDFSLFSLLADAMGNDGVVRPMRDLN